jgi:hypothetical protein
MKSILVQAIAAEEPMGADAFAAGDADRRQQEIGKRRQRAAQRSRSRKGFGSPAGPEVISAPPIAMDAMIEPGAGRAEEARNA